MEIKADFNSIYKLSEDIVARDVQGEFIIIPIAQGVGDAEEAIFSLNNFGKAIWDKLDGKRSLKEIAGILSAEFEAAPSEIENDCLGFAQELLQRKMIVKL